MKNPPIIIIGAGRSGTNILRDCLCRLQGLRTWPCDEINYIWRHGNINKTTDRFTSEEARSEVKLFILKSFEKFEHASNANYIVEKTCANSLRVPFIDAIFPDAKYIFIIRDGMDVASSAKQRWTAPLEIKYILKKARFVPIRDLHYYGFRYSVNRIKKIFSLEKRLAFWGPLYPGMMDDIRKDTLVEVCGKQWKACVEIAYNDLNNLKKGKVHYLKYEDFVTRPVEEMKKVVHFLDLGFSEKELQMATDNVSSKSIGNYKRHIKSEDLIRLNSIVKPIMEAVYNKI